MKKVLLLLLFTAIISFAKAQNRKSYYTLYKADSLIQQPEFIGGKDLFNKFITTNQDVIGAYNVHGDSYELRISCYVEKDGTLSNIKIFNSDECSECDIEAVRLLTLSQKWKPATYNGKSKRVKILIFLNLKTLQYVYEPPEQRFTKDELRKTKMIYVTPTVEPEFPNGLDSLYSSINNKLLPYRQKIDFINGAYVIAFVVEKNGELSNFNVLRCPNDTLAKKIVKILSRSPKWKPGTVQNIIVRSNYTLKIPIHITNN